MRAERRRSPLWGCLGTSLLLGLKLGCTGLKLPFSTSSIIPRGPRFGPGGVEGPS